MISSARSLSGTQPCEAVRLPAFGSLFKVSGDDLPVQISAIEVITVLHGSSSVLRKEPVQQLIGHTEKVFQRGMKSLI